MFSSVSISNYRGLRSLEIDPLSRVNLIAGANNSGKTSVLEAVFLLSHGGNPRAAVNAHVVRGGVSSGFPPEANARALWTPLFSNLELTKTIAVAARHRGLGSLRLQIDHRFSDTVQSVTGSRESMGDSPGTPELHFFLTRRLDGKTSRLRGQVSLQPSGFEVEMSDDPVVVPCVILSTCDDQAESDAKRLGRLRQKKQGHVVVKALRIIEPRLQEIEVIPGPGGHQLWGDVGLAELVPLAVLGDGLNRLARLVLAIGHNRHHVVLVDEIETGYHYSILDRVWEVVHVAAREFDAQVIATTHSYDCISAAHRTSRGQDFGLHRLEADGQVIRCVTYDSESIEGAIEHHLEVR